MKNLLIVVGMILLVWVILFITPLAFIWSVNTLFGLSIPYTSKYFLAAWLLLGVIRLVTRTERETLRR